MTITHISHFGLTCIGTMRDSIMFTGTKADCMRMAFAHSMEVEKYEGAMLGCVGGVATVECGNAERFNWCFFKDGGFIHRERDGYILLMPLELWEKDKI